MPEQFQDILHFQQLLTPCERERADREGKVRVTGPQGRQERPTEYRMREEPRRREEKWLKGLVTLLQFCSWSQFVLLSTDKTISFRKEEQKPD